jgi:hypothetical protein
VPPGSLTARRWQDYLIVLVAFVFLLLGVSIMGKAVGLSGADDNASSGTWRDAPSRADRG